MDGLAECSPDVVPLQPLCLVRRVWFVTMAIQLLWFAVYIFRWPIWREHHPSYLLLTHAVLISLLVPKIWLGGTEIFEMLRSGHTMVGDQPGAAAREFHGSTFISWSGQAVAGVFAGLLRLRHDPRALRLSRSAP